MTSEIRKVSEGRREGKYLYSSGQVEFHLMEGTVRIAQCPPQKVVETLFPKRGVELGSKQTSHFPKVGIRNHHSCRMEVHIIHQN